MPPARVPDGRLTDWLIARGHADTVMLTQLAGDVPDLSTLHRAELEDLTSLLSWRLVEITVAIDRSRDAAAERVSQDLREVVAAMRDLGQPVPDHLPDDW